MPLRVLLAFALPLLAGCPVSSRTAAPPPPTAEAAPLERITTLDLGELVVKDDASYPPTIRRLDYAEDGRHLLLLTSTTHREQRKPLTIYHLLLLNTETATLERKIPLSDILTSDVGMFLVGFLDNEHYFASKDDDLLIFRLGENEPKLRHVGRGGGDFANRRHIADFGFMIDWRTGQTYRAIVGTLGVSDLTDDDWVISGERNGYIARHNPVSGEYQEWRSGFSYPTPFASASGRYVIAAGPDLDCRVWRVPEREQVGRCKHRWFGGGKRWSTYAAHPTRERFAIAWRETVRVYDIEPFELKAELQLDDTARQVAFAGEDKLVALTQRDVQVWSVREQRLIAADRGAAMHFGEAHDLPHTAELVNPNGRQIAVARSHRDHNDITFYALPE